MDYISNTEHEKNEMLKEINVHNILDLFNDVDKKLILKEKQYWKLKIDLKRLVIFGSAR